jgi:arsenate reductase
MLELGATCRGDEEEKAGFAVEVRFDQGTGVDGLVRLEIREREGLESAQGSREFIHLPGLPRGEIGGFEIAGVILAFRLAPGIGGGGVGFLSGLGEAFEIAAQLGADLFQQSGFHQGAARLARRRPLIKIRRMLTVYAYQKCSTCRDALKWLASHGIPHEVKAIRETPPTVAELKTVLTATGGDLRKLFNTSGVDYRELGMKDKLPAMNEAQALEVLSANGNLVKRPFAVGDGKALVGFKEAEWVKAVG